MPVSGFSVGKDVKLNLNLRGGILRVILTDFEAKPVYSDLKSTPLNGPPIHLSVPAGWKGTAKLDRQGPAIDDYVTAYEAAYWAGENMLTGTITETISEPDGTISKYRFTNVNIKVTEPGSWGGEKKVEQSLEFEASRRLAA